MPALVDTTIRLLGQEPLAGRDADGRAAPARRDPRRRGFRLPRGLGRRRSSTPRLARRREPMGADPRARRRARRRRSRWRCAAASSSARGRSGGDFVRRFVASAAESGIEVFRLHDPLNDVSNLREAAEAITAAGREFDAGLVYGSGHTARPTRSSSRRSRLPELGAARVLLHDPSGSLAAAPRAASSSRRSREASGLPVGLYCQGAGGQRARRRRSRPRAPAPT